MKTAYFTNAIFNKINNIIEMKYFFQKRGGALIRGAALIRGNTVLNAS